ncbi:hypothetical protein IT570_02590 [Candidatus Sumerlaeota bacterium]|nr:hypothetical protein [Candidatus Sumerlaeota bacterium]
MQIHQAFPDHLPVACKTRRSKRSIFAFDGGGYLAVFRRVTLKLLLNGQQTLACNNQEISPGESLENRNAILSLFGFRNTFAFLEG